MVHVEKKLSRVLVWSWKGIFWVRCLIYLRVKWSSEIHKPHQAEQQAEFGEHTATAVATLPQELWLGVKTATEWLISLTLTSLNDFVLNSHSNDFYIIVLGTKSNMIRRMVNMQGGALLAWQDSSRVTYVKKCNPSGNQEFINFCFWVKLTFVTIILLVSYYLPFLEITAIWCYSNCRQNGHKVTMRR